MGYERNVVRNTTRHSNGYLSHAWKIFKTKHCLEKGAMGNVPGPEHKRHLNYANITKKIHVLFTNK